jgi:hypothetical protein
MKQLRKTEDRAMDRLLRGHPLQQSGLQQVCKQFDPDLANAYIEHSLTAAERERIEQHMSLCAPCRTAIVALARLAEAEAPASAARPGQQAAEGWRERLGALAGAMTTPRWAMAAAAVIVLAVSVPVLLSRISTRNNALLVAEERAADARSVNPSEDKAQPEGGNSTPRSVAGAVAQDKHASADQAQSVGATTSLKSPDRTEPLLVAKNQAPAEETPSVAAKKTEVLKEKGEAAGAVAGAAGALVQTEHEVAAQPPQAAPPTQQRAAGETQLPKIDQERALRLQQQGKDSTQDSLLKQGRADGDQRSDKVAKIRPEDDVAPPAPAAPEGIRNRVLAQPGASAMRAGRLNESSRTRGTAERKVGSKKFWLRGDTWTDKDYSPIKEMPVVTIVRDSDVYRELIARRAGLKVYLTSFNENDRAILVYKGTVYKLIPQEGNK